MTNVASFSREDLAAILGESASILPANIMVRGVSTDTRSLVPGNVFIALRGEQFNGHSHIEEAISKGASLIIAEHSNGINHGAVPVVVVKSTLHCLGSFGWYHRRRFAIPIIAIAGAAGKTSTKDIVAHVLASEYNVLKTQANFNNQIGTPLTLLQLRDEHHVAVIEIGTNEPGEIETLAAMVQPTMGLITNIGKEHLEKLVDLDGVEREETALYDYLRDHGGLALVNMDDERLAKYAGSFSRSVTFAVDSHAEIRPHVHFDAELHPDLHIVHGTFTFRAAMKSVGLASAYNATCAIAVAWAMQVHPSNVRSALQSYAPPASHGYARMVVERVHGAAILNDTYNANPESMLMALNTLQRFPAAKRIAVLGDMRELGITAEEEHMHILSAAENAAHLVMIMGSEFRRAFERVGGPHTVFHETHHGLAQDLLEHLDANTAVLVKGSRGMTMERVIEALHHASS